MFIFSFSASAASTATILAGGETDLPADTPSGRLDTAAEFSFVGSLAISSGGGNYKGSAVALSPEWVLTAGHNVDLNDDGLPDALWAAPSTCRATARSALRRRLRIPVSRASRVPR